MQSEQNQGQHHRLFHNAEPAVLHHGAMDARYNATFAVRAGHEHIGIAAVGTVVARLILPEPAWVGAVWYDDYEHRQSADARGCQPALHCGFDGAGVFRGADEHFGFDRRLRSGRQYLVVAVTNSDPNGAARGPLFFSPIAQEPEPAVQL